MAERFREIAIRETHGAGEVRLRLLDLEATAGDVALAADTLSGDELRRASRFRFERDRSSYILVRSALRKSLGEALEMAPRDVVFRYGPEGKPFVDGNSEVEFNASHSRGIGILAIAFGRRVGVDVEFVSPELFDGGLAERLLTHRELQALREVPKERQDGALIAFWTRKEAYVKAVGGGLSIPLSSFSVSFLPDEIPRLLEAGGDEPLRGWSIAAFAPAPGYLAAVVTEGEGWSGEPSAVDFLSANVGGQNAEVSNPPHTSEAGLK